MKHSGTRPVQRLAYILLLVVLVYVATVVYPEFLFRHKARYGSFTVYYHSSLKDTAGLGAVLLKSTRLLTASPLFDKGREQKLFMCGSYDEFRFFNPLASEAFAVNYPVTQNIFLAKADIEGNSVYRYGGTNNRRSLSGVIAHETVHTLLERHLGYRAYRKLPVWKSEGYCDFIAKESSMDTEEGHRHLCNATINPSASARYFIYRLCVHQLLHEEGVAHKAFLNGSHSYSKARSRAAERICK